MKRVLGIFFTAALWATSLRAELMPIADAAHDPTWRDLFAHLAPSKARQSTFEERRFFPFRKEPVVLTGELRIEPARGLSLRYLTPEDRLLIADEKGLLLRDAEGRERTPPSDARAQAAMNSMIDVLRFDLPQLQKTFSLRGERVSETWTLEFAPKDPALSTALGTIVLRGDGERLRKIELIRSPTQRIEILVGETHENVIFTGDTLKRFFR